MTPPPNDPSAGEISADVTAAIRRAVENKGIPPWLLWVGLAMGTGGGTGSIVDIFGRINDVEDRVTSVQSAVVGLRDADDTLNAIADHQTAALARIERNVLRLCIATEAGCESN